MGTSTVVRRAAPGLCAVIMYVYNHLGQGWQALLHIPETPKVSYSSWSLRNMWQCWLGGSSKGRVNKDQDQLKQL